MVKRWLGVMSMTVLAGIITVMGLAAPVMAAKFGQPVDMQIGMQLPASDVAVDLENFYELVNFIIIGITLFVLVLMIYVMYRFSEKRNATPSRTTHHALLEVAWTVIPIIILVAIAVPSFKLLNFQYAYPKPDITIKATGYQWYWSHEYLDHGGFSFDSVMLQDDERQELIDEGIPSPRNLAVDNEVILPVNKVVHVLVTAQDVIHAWAIPSFGTKTDAVPGRITATWFKSNVEGVFYGQCSELCGKDHAFMPIAIRVVNEATFNSWAEAMQANDKKKAREIIRAVAIEQAQQNVAAVQQ
jgi:cytochrome c oxidase subunit 2